MKKGLLILFICIFVHAFAQNTENLFYYGYDEKICITQVYNKYAFCKDTNTFQQEVEHALDETYAGISDKTWLNNNICIVTFKDQNPAPIMQDTKLSTIKQYPVFSVNSTSEVILFPEIVVKEKCDQTSLNDLEQKYNLSLRKDGVIYKIYGVPTNDNVIAIANELYETGQFEFASPNFFCPIETYAYIPNDTYFPYQISLHNTGQTINDNHVGTEDADIDAPEAWEITKGLPDIIIAVIDKGVTNNHPDLPNSRQVRLNGSNLGVGDPNDPSPVVGNVNHGNACAGVIAATMDNNEGISGIAPNCKIMPIRYDDSNSLLDLADGIRLAVDSGAHILSCSWGTLNPSTSMIPAINSAINYAIAHNVVVIFAAGNLESHSPTGIDVVSFPANVNIPYVITVGASDRDDQLAAYSPISPLIDIVAPSHKADPTQINGETFEMWSIDIPGDNGYNPNPIERSDYIPEDEILPNYGTNYLAYTGRFGGTSHSCPVVAGVAALMLSANTSLTNVDIYDILTKTCDKIGDDVAYVNGKCNEFGHGRVNAYRAVHKAQQGYSPYIDGPATVEDSIAWYSVRDIPIGATITWSIDNISSPHGNLWEFVLTSSQNNDSMRVAFRQANITPGPWFPHLRDSTSISAFSPFYKSADLTVTINRGAYSYSTTKRIRKAISSSPFLLQSHIEQKELYIQLLNADYSQAQNNSCNYTLELCHSIYGCILTKTNQSNKIQIEMQLEIIIIK